MRRISAGMVYAVFFMIALAMLIPAYVQAGSPGTIRVEAWIDGRSQIKIAGNTAQWHHFDFNAPGREGGNFPTIINGDRWFPRWPSVGGNSFCDCDSNIFTEVNPSLDAVTQTVALNIIQGRGSVSIVQQPAVANNYELIVEFNDNSFGGADWYIIELQAPSTTFVNVTVPTMTEWGMIIFVVLAGLGATYHMRREKRA